MIDEPQFSRYRFIPTEECPGTASGRHGLAYTPTAVQEDIPLVRSTSLHSALLLHNVHRAVWCF